MDIISHNVQESKSSQLVTYIAFLCTITVVGISVISVIFPALILSSTYDYPNNLNTFEISPWLIPILISTISLIVIGFLYKNKKLPQKFYSGIKLIFNFEISKKTSIILGILII